MLNSFKFDFALVVCVYGGILPRTHWSILKAYLNGMKFYHPIRPEDALITRSRSVEATHFLTEKLAPYLVFVDSDIGFQPYDLSRLIDNMKQGKELIGGCYVVKDGSQLAQHGIDGKINLDNEIHEVEYISTGFFGVTRWVLEKMVKDLDLPLCNKGAWCEAYPFFESARYYDEKVGWMLMSEDWDFCNKAKQIGVMPHLDTSIRVTHTVKTERTVEEMLERQKT